MDLWVVAAAAGAGYIAKYWQNIAGEGGEVSLESQTNDSIVGQSEFRNQVRPLKKLTQKQLGREDEEDSRFSEVHRLGNSNAAGGLASTSGRGVVVEKAEDYNILSLASLPPGLLGRGNVNDLGSGSSGRNEVYDKLSLSPDSKREELHHSHRFAKRRLLRSRRPYGYSVKPVNSVESCLTAQLYRDHSEIQEFILSSLPRQSIPSARSLLVTDCNRVISRASSDFKADATSRASRDFKRDLQFDGVEERMLLGAPPLPKRSMEIQRRSMEMQRRSMDVQRRSRLSIGGLQFKRSNISSTRVDTEAGKGNAQGNPMPDTMLLFFVGITIGILSAGVANKREIEKLNELLKQNENLVHDLHDELEMKSSLSVKELPNERHSSPKLGQELFFDEESTTRGETKLELDNSINVDSKKENQKSENFETMSKIEAELEAELERLELNMKASTLERISGLVELDPEFEADVVPGELKLKPIRRDIVGISDSDHDVSGASTNHLKTQNYSVSPRELSLRIHEVIQSRLEMRIMELEAELQDSQKRGQFSRSENLLFRRAPYNDIECSSTHESLDDGDEIDQPLVINLSGEAIDAYNEAYEEIFRMTKTEEETPTDTMYNSDHGRYDKELCPTKRDFSEERLSESRVHNKIRGWEEQISSQESGEGGESESEDEDDLGELLIKQIVEKARQGSPAIRNAQMMLYAMDEQ